MTNLPERPDLTAIANEAQAELLVAESVAVGEAMAGDAEIGYYEADLQSLRDAATALRDAEGRSR